MKTESAIGGSQLFRVTRAHRYRVVTERESAFQEIDLAVPLELMEVERLRRNSQISNHGWWEVPLISGVVDG